VSLTLTPRNDVDGTRLGNKLSALSHTTRYLEKFDEGIGQSLITIYPLVCNPLSTWRKTICTRWFFFTNQTNTTLLLSTLHNRIEWFVTYHSHYLKPDTWRHLFFLLKKLKFI